MVDAKKLLELTQDHPDFDKDRFVSEGRVMKELGLLDDFFCMCERFIAGKLTPGSINKCNSHIAYCMGMTTQYPQGKFKPVEKMKATRISPPDVDIDFDYDRQHEIYKYLIDTYGEDYTCNIGTYIFLKAKSTLKGVAKVMDLGNDWEPGMKKTGPRTLEVADEISKMTPYTAKTIAEAVEEMPILGSVIRKYPNYGDVCNRVQGAAAYGGVHPAGIIVSNRKIKELAPLRRSNDVICSQFDKDEMEDIGLLKFDILALKTLSVINNTLKLIKESGGPDIDIDRLVPNDEDVFKMLNSGATKGIFQMEGGGITRLLQAIHVDSFEDMIATNAIFRPGPLGANVHELYCDMKHGRIPVTYEHPSMERALKPTYGLIVYQEQVMNISKDMAGFTSSEADKLRKAIGKKKMDIMEQMRHKFTDGCGINGISKQIAIETWDKIEKFGGYGFNRSHSACYAFLAYQTAYLKRYHTYEFMCSLMSSEIGDQEKVASYIGEAKRLGMNVYRPHVNRSSTKFIIEYDDNAIAIRAPMNNIKGIGENAVKVIVENQPYTDMRDFVTSTNCREVTSKVVELLVDHSCFNGLGEQKELVEQFHAIKKELQTRKADPKNYSGISFFDL